jgi:hypothetical protein
MTAQTKAKIMLTALIGGGGLPTAVYLLTIEQAVIYGWLVILLVFGILLWLWQPWTWFRKKPKR